MTLASIRQKLIPPTSSRSSTSRPSPSIRVERKARASAGTSERSSATFVSSYSSRVKSLGSLIGFFLPAPWQDHSHLRAFGQGSPVRLHRGGCLRGHGVLLLLRAGEPIFAFRGSRAPSALLAHPIGGEDI